VRELLGNGAFRISTQVLQEFYVTTTRKVRSLLSPEVTLRYVARFSEWPVVAIDASAVLEAAQLCIAAQLSFWHSLILIAARRSGAQVLYSEDLQHGEVVLGVRIVNPFRAAPPVE
jgi:predicted nucleic acid-binding protein